jgi:hypothetical protein
MTGQSRNLSQCLARVNSRDSSERVKPPLSTRALDLSKLPRNSRSVLTPKPPIGANLAANKVPFTDEGLQRIIRAREVNWISATHGV